MVLTTDDDSSMQRVVLLDRYDDRWWPVSTAVCVIGASLFGLCVIGNLILQQAIVWGDAYAMLILGAVIRPEFQPISSAIGVPPLARCMGRPREDV